MKHNFASRLLAGVMIITVGVVFLLRQLGYIDLSVGDVFRTYWPVILIYFGLKQVLTSRFAGSSMFGGLLLLGLGVVFLGNNLNFLSMTLGDIIPFAIPFIIIWVGLTMILKPAAKKREAPADDEWKSYRPYDKNNHVPPAPPLHPDPTGRFDDDFNEKSRTGQGNDGIGQEQGSRQGHQDSYREPDNEQKWDKWNKSSKWDKRENNQDHVEWWNHDDPNVVSRSGFIGDIHMGQDYWELKPLNISHFIGDTVLDLTKAQIPFGETKINISSFIGDVKIYVPNDYELGIQVVSNTFIGDVKVLGRKEGGIMANVNIQTPRYADADKKIKLVVSSFIGDTRVTKVG